MGLPESTERTQLFQEISDLIGDDEGTLEGLERLVTKILTLVHRHYRAQNMDFIIEIDQSPFEDAVLSQLVAICYRDLLRKFNMQQLGEQELVTLDFDADPVTHLTLGFSKATCQMFESMWLTFQRKIARVEAKARKD